MAKEKYNGLLTRRTAVECAPLLGGSPTKIKVKTDVSTGEWENVEVEEALQTTITTDFGS